jgi:hypothetical protein
VRVAVVGAGRIAEQHLRALDEVPDLEVGVCDLSPVTAEFAAERFGLSHHYTDFGAMLDEIRPEVVHVTTPVGAHVPLAMRSLAAGAHTLVEKPVAPSYSEWLALRSAAASAQRWLIEDHPYHFSRPVQRVLGLIESGRFGEVVHVDATLSLDLAAPGSVFADVHCRHPSYAMPGGPISDSRTSRRSAACSSASTSPRERSGAAESTAAAPFDEMRHSSKPDAAPPRSGLRRAARRIRGQRIRHAHDGDDEPLRGFALAPAGLARQLRADAALERRHWRLDERR